MKLSKTYHNTIKLFCKSSIDEETAKVYGQIKAALIKEFSPQQKTKRKTTKITELGFDENDL
ncbi:MAG: hypothetical protein RSE13_14020 [Planktothrix sp. GU0601_MAG3]|nr:MAG: hypothetical protein RSE13_14020 [Planktothrix sp. GU0601_MAG3]